MRTTAITYKHGKLDASPDQCGNFRMRRDEGVDHGAERLDRPKDGTQAHRDTAALPQLIVAVQLSGEYHDRVCISDGADAFEFSALFVCQYVLEILDGVFQGLSRAARQPSRGRCCH